MGVWVRRVGSRHYADLFYKISQINSFSGLTATFLCHKANVMNDIRKCRVIRGGR